MTPASDTRERARARVREIDRNESALAIELFDGNRWFTISLPPNRRVAELQHELLTLSLAAFAESEAALARKQEREDNCDVIMANCERHVSLAKRIITAIHERNLAETGG